MNKLVSKILAARRMFDLDKSYYPSDFLLDVLYAYKKRTTSTKNHIFITCFPKSGSTYITKKLRDVTGYEDGKYVYYYLRNERELSKCRFIDNMSRHTVSQHHTRATEYNVMLLNQYNVKPIVLLRNIFDVVISMRDHFLREGPANPYAYLTDDFFKLSEEQQYDQVIEMVVPWYFNYYVSWCEAERENSIPVKWMHYEDIMANKAKGMKEILDYYNIDISLEVLQAKIEDQTDKGKTRFNKGVSGRGLQILSEEQIEKIKSYTKFNPSIDFSKMGL